MDLIIKNKPVKCGSKTIFLFKKKIKCKIISTDKEMSEYCNVPLWDGDHI